MGKIFALVKPAKIDQRLWTLFVSSKCSCCENPRDGCTNEAASIEQAKKCFKEWCRKQYMKEWVERRKNSREVIFRFRFEPSLLLKKEQLTKTSRESTESDPAWKNNGKPNTM